MRPPTAASVLLVEDDTALRTAIADALLPRFDIFTAEDRGTALSSLRSHPGIAVAMIDLGLPPFPHSPREGLALLQAIRVERLPVKAIVLTGQDREKSALAAVQEGAFDFLEKPASLDAMANAIDRARLFSRMEKELADRGITRLAVTVPLGRGLRQVRDEAEEQLVRTVLQDTDFNIHEAARRLGIKRENVYYFLKKFGIVRTL